jgi:ATP-binding cassette subfamily B protein RaxB
MLARALYRQPRILVMDEGTSALDIATERRVNAALKGMGITRIVAAHRPEMLASADRVVGLQEGRLVPVKLELRSVSATEAAETLKMPKDHDTDGIGLRRDHF